MVPQIQPDITVKTYCVSNALTGSLGLGRSRISREEKEVRIKVYIFLVLTK
jgi:hypothetical protein